MAGMSPSLISGKEIFVFWDAIIKSPNKASSNPPPNVYPLIHEIIGLLKFRKISLIKSKKSFFTQSLSFNYFIFAPQQKDLSKDDFNITILILLSS